MHLDDLICEKFTPRPPPPLLGRWPATVATPMAAAAGAAIAGGSRASPTVHLRPADASRDAHEPPELVSRGGAARLGGSGAARERPVRAPVRPGKRELGLRRARGGRGDAPALERLRARERQAAAGLVRPSARAPAAARAHRPIAPQRRGSGRRPPQARATKRPWREVSGSAAGQGKRPSEAAQRPQRRARGPSRVQR